MRIELDERDIETAKPSELPGLLTLLTRFLSAIKARMGLPAKPVTNTEAGLEVAPKSAEPPTGDGVYVTRSKMTASVDRHLAGKRRRPTSWVRDELFDERPSQGNKALDDLSRLR